MKIVVAIPHRIKSELLAHLFQDKLEQGAFLFAEASESEEEIVLDVRARYLVPPEGWEVQEEDILVMKDSERAKIMKMARDMGLAAVDCHSHPRSGAKVSFSPSDRGGASEFAQYAGWKLGRKPFVTTVWGEESVDAVAWYSDFRDANPVTEIRINGDTPMVSIPRGTWFLPYRSSPGRTGRW